MKQFVLLIAMVLVGSTGSLFNPFWGLMLYYSLSVLRPQDLWNWAMPEPWPWSRMAAGAVIVGVFLNMSDIWKRSRVTLVPILLVCYVILLTFSTLTAHDPGWSQHWLFEYAKVLLLAFITCFVVHRYWHLRTLAAIILIGLGYIAWEVNYLYLFDGRLDIFHHGFGDLDNNGAGLMLAMGIPFAYAFAVSASRWWMRAISAALGLVIIHAVLMTYSRGAMVASIIAMLWILWHHRPRIQAAIIALILVGAIALLAGQEIQDRFMLTFDAGRDYSAQSRMTSWSAALEIVKEHPLTGVGIRNSNTYTHNYGADHVGRTIHSQYLQIAADCGLPALMVYLMLVGTALYLMTKSRWKLLAHQESLAGLTRTDEDCRLFQMEKLILSAQASLVLFAFGSVFLSLEVFETPWLVIAMASTMPGIVADELEGVETQVDAAPSAEPPPMDAEGKRQKRSILRFNPAVS